MLVAGTSWANRVASLLQLCTVAGLIEVVLYMPAIQRAMIPQTSSGFAVGSGWPPVWFAALYGAMADGPRGELEPGSARAVWALLLALIAAIALSLLPAGVFARRTLQASARQGTAIFAAVWHGLGRLVAPTPTVCAVLRFTVVSLVRSSRHGLIVASYVGAAVAISGVDAIAALVRGTLHTDAPSPPLLAMPLALLYLGVVGTRAAFAAPLDQVATWPLRLAPPSTHSARAATRLSLVLCVVLPVSGLSAAGAVAVGWSLLDVVLVAALNLAAGVMLIEGLLVGWSIVPFTCAREISTETVQWRWVGFLLPLLAFVFVGARIQASALAEARVAVAVLVSLTVGTVAVAAWSRLHENTARVAFEIEAGHSVQTLGLSEAER